MALQWRETSFLASHSAARVQVPIDFAVEEPEEDLDFILEVEEAIKPTRVEISEGFSSNNESEDGAQITATEVKRDSVARATSEGAPLTLKELQNELQMMQRETQALQNLLVSNGGSGGEAAQGTVEAWQQRNVFQGVARRADAGMVSVGVTSTTSQVMYRRQHTEEVVTHRRSASRRLRRPRPGNRGYISSSSDDSPELPRFRDVRDAIPRASKENKGTRTSGSAAKEDPGRATDAAPVTQVTEDATVMEATSRNGEVSHTKVQAAGNPVTEKVSKEITTTEDRVIEDALTENSVRERGMADEGLRESTATVEPATGVTIAEEPVRVDGAAAEYVTGNGVTEQPTTEEKVTEEPNTENIALEEPLQKTTATEEQLIEQVTQEDPSHKYVPAEHDTTQHLSPEDQDTTDANNGRRSRSSYHNMIEEMGYSTEDNLSDEWKEEDFEETNFMTTSESPDVSEPTEIVQVAMAGTEDGSAAQYEKPLLSETPGKNVKPSKPTGTLRKSSLGAETVVKPYLETNLDNPVLYYLEKVSEAKSPSPTTPSKEPDGDVPKVDLLNLESEKKPQSSQATEQKLDTAEEPNENPVFEHIEKEADQAKTETLEKAKSKALLEGGDTQDVVNEPPSHVVTHSDTGTSPQPSEETEIVASPTMMSPVASVEETSGSIHGGRSTGKRRPSQKPPPPPRTSSLLPSDAEPQSQVGTLSKAPPSTPDPTSPHGSVGSSSSSLESEAPASEDARLREQDDHPHADGLKRVSAVYEELEKIDIPRVPSPPPLEAASKSPDLSTPNINKYEALNSASILSEEPALLGGLQKEHMIPIPETSGKTVQRSATDLLVASPSLSSEGTSMLVTDSESSDGQHKFPDEDSQTTTSKHYTSEESLPSSLEHIPEDTRKSPSQSHPQVDEPGPPGMSSTQGREESPDQSLDSDSVLTEHLETPSPILSESPGLVLSDLEKIDIPGIPPPPPRHPPPKVASPASLLPAAETPPSQVSKDSPALHSTMPLAQVLFDLEKMDIPGVPPPPPRQPPPPPPVQSTVSPPLETSLQAIPEESIIPSDTCSSSANESFIQPSEGSADDSAPSESSFCDSNDSAPREDDKKATETLMTLPLQKSFHYTETVLERLESLEIPEVPPPPPVGSPPAVAMQSSPIQLCGPSSLIEGDFPPEFKENPAMKARSCSPTLSSESSQGNGAETPSSRRLKELEEMEIPEVPPPLPRQPPPIALDPTQTTIIETPKTQTRETSDGSRDSPSASNTKSCQRRFLESLQGQTPEETRPQSMQISSASCLTQESPSTSLSYSPVNPSIPPQQLLEELEKMEIPEVPPPPPLQPPPSLDPSKAHSADSFQNITPRTSEVYTTPFYDVLSDTEPPKKLGGDTEASETSPTPAEEIESSPMSNPITSPQVANVSPSHLLEELEKMEIPEVPPPPPRRPLPPPPPRSLAPQHPLPYPRHSELSSTSDSSSPFAAHTDLLHTPASSSTSTQEDSPASTPQPFTIHTSEVSPKQDIETSAAEASSEINVSVPSFPPPVQPQVTPKPLDDTSSTQSPSDSLKQCPEFVGTEYLLEESQFFPSNVSSQQVPEAYLARVIENSLAELSPMAEELPQAPVGGSLSHYVASLNKHFSPSEEDTTSSSSSSSDESSSEEEASSSSSSEHEHLGTSEHEAASILTSQVYSVPEIKVSSVPEAASCITPDEQQQTEAAPQNVVVASAPEELVDSVPEKVTASVPGEGIASVLKKVVDSVPKKMVDSVPEMIVSVPVKVAASMPEEAVDSVSDTMVVSVPEKVVASMPEKVSDSVPEKVVASVPEKVVASVPDKVVESVPEKVVASVPDKVVESMPEKVVASVPEKVVASVPEKVVASVPEKVVASVPDKVVESVPEKVVASVPEKVVASVPEKVVASVPKKTVVSSDPKKVMFSSVPENVVATAVACSEPERGVASVLERVVICAVPETVVISSSSQEEVSSSSEGEVSSAHNGVSSLSPQKAASLPQSPPPPEVSSPRKDSDSSQQLDSTSSLEEEAISSSQHEPSPTRDYEASSSASQVSPLPDVKISLASEAKSSITPDEKPENFPLPNEAVPAPEVVASSMPEKVMVSSEPDRDRISSLPPGDSPLSGRVSPSSDEISSSTGDGVPSVPKITISFAPDMECPYASETEEVVVSAPEKVPSLVEEETVSFSSGTSSRPDAQQETSSTAEHKSSTPKEETFEIHQFHGSPSQSCDNSTPVTEASSIVRQGKIASSAPYQQSQDTEGSPPQSHSASTHQVSHPAAERPKEVQEGSLTQAAASSPPPSPAPATPAKHSAAQTKCTPPTMVQSGSAPRAPASFPLPRPPPAASPKPSSAQVTRHTPPIKPSVKPPLPPTQPSSARSTPPIKPSVKPPLPPRPTQPSTSRCPPPVKPSVKPPLPPKPTQSSSTCGAATKHSSQSATEPHPRQAPVPPHELSSSQAQLVEPVTSLVPEAELKKEDKEDETEWKEGRKRGISQSSEETEEEYFTPPSDSPPHSPVPVRNQTSSKDFNFTRRQWSPHQEGAEKNLEFVTWGHELEVIVDPYQRNEISDAGTSQAPPDAGKRHSQPDLSDLPSTKRRRLSCGDEEDDIKNVLTVCRVRSRSPSPSRHRFSRLTSAIEEALNAEQPEQSYEIQITVSVLKPSHSPQTTSPEPRVRISTHMRADSPAPPSQRPSRPAPPPPDKSVRSKERKKEKATAASSSDAANPPLSPSVSGESPSKGKSRIEKSRERKSRKKREHVDGSATRKTTVTSLKEGKKEEEKEKEEKEEENEAAKRAMMEFYVNNLSSDTDSDASTSSTSTSTSSSDDDGEDDGRSYQVTAPGEMGLATIEEDAEEDSGAESSGHWMFSADNTDTESVIHVPAALTPAPIEPPPLHRPAEDGDSTASDETLVVEEEDDEEEKDVCGGGEGRGGRQEAGVTVSNSHARTPASTPATGGHYDSSASEDEHGSQGTERPADGSSLRAVHRRRRKPGDGRPAGGGARLPHANMLGPAHATRIFEKHVDDVFDFESLESCESVSGGSEASSPGHPGSLSGLEEADVVFNMSATSQPFADVSPTLVGTARKIYTPGGAASVPKDLEGSVSLSKLREGDGAPCLIPTPDVAPAGMDGEENESDLSNVLSSAGTDLVLPSSNSDGSEAAEDHYGPQSMDMFGLPMRWTPGHDPRQSTADTIITVGNRNTVQAEAEESMIQMRSECDELTFANKETHLNTSDRRSSRAAVSSDADLAPPPEAVETSVSDATQEVRSAASEAQQQEIVSVSAFIVGENSSEARHRHTPHGPAHHYHFSLAPLPQQSESEALLLPPSGVSDKDDVQDAMRDVLRPPLLRGDTATKGAVGSFPCGEVTSVVLDEKAADYYTSGEAEYVSPGLRPQPVRSMPCGVDFPSVDSDTDTDNTDGDYDEEDHFAAELSLRISSVPATATTKVKSFRSSDILNLIGLQGGGAGPSGAGGASGDVSPPASQTGSSPEVPDSLRSSEGRSATRSVETLSEDSGLGDRDVQLTPSSPLASISEAAPRLDPAPPATASATSRLRRQDVRQARIARARSCGDLRGYTDSDSEEERGAMYGWPSHPSAQPLTEGVNGASYGSRTQPRPYKPNYTNHHQQHDEYRAARLPHRPHPLSGSEGSDEEFRSRFTNHRVVPSGHSKPRRHRSFHEASRQDPAGWAGKGSWVTTPGAPRPGRRRPQPISVDLAEQFLSQEGLKSPQRKQTVEDPYGAAGEGRGEEWRMQHPPSLPGTGGVACQAARSMPANQQPPSEVSTNGASVGSAGSGSELCPPASSLTPELTVRRAWPAAEAALPPLATPSRPAPAPPSTRPPGPAPLSPQYSSTPAQLPNECQPVHTGRSSSSPAHDPPSNTDSELRAASDLNEQCFSGRTGAEAAASDGVTTEMEGGPARVHTKTYGSHGEVEVYLARSDSGCRPPNTSPILTPRGDADHRSGSRGVTFSPSVKEINWRESYYEAEPEEGEEAGSSVRKVLVVTSESPTPQRVDLTPSPPPAAHVPTSDSQTVNITPETSPSAPADSVSDTKTNGRVSEGPAGSSSDAEMSEDKSPRVQTPLWQRFRLPKISSPKSPRPKIPPKPQSLSSRSSDTESSKLSSPGMDSSSSTPSSPDTKAKKAPASPRFFSWGSKREKKARVPPPRPVVSPPPPPAQVNVGQRGEVPGEQAGVKGEPDPAAAVSPAVLPREDRAGASENNSEAVREEQQSVWPPTREERVTVFPVRPVATERPCFTDSDGLSHESGRSPLTSATSGEDSSDAAPHPSPRSALSKPPLPPHLQRPNQQVFHKARLLSARRQYFSQERQVSAPERSSPPKEVPAPPVPKPREALQQRISTSRYNSAFNASSDLKERFERFSASARAERERLARSTPDLSVIEASVRRQGPRIDLWNQCEQQQQQAESHPASPASASDGDAARPDLAHRGASSSHQKARAAIHERYKNRAQRIHARARTQSSGVLETDLDTGASREVLTLRETNLDDLYRDLQHLLDTIPPVGAAPTQTDKTRAKSLLDLEATAAMEAQLAAPARPPDTRAKSMEFLLDDGNKASIQPPENELMKGSERQLSEAELRVRRSLQRLDVPEWMKNAPPPQQGFLLRRREYGSSSAPAGGWSAYSSKTASMTSLGSSRAVTPNTPTKVVIPTRVASRGVGGIGGVTSPASNCSISPSPSDRSGSLFQYPISRWSTSRLNSGTTTPTGSVTSSRTTTTYTRQPYLGWRSQTSLASLAGSQSSLTSTGSYLTAADRLALGITSYSQRFVKTTPSTQDKENSSSEANAAAPKPETAEQNDTSSTNGSVKLQVPADVADVHSSIKEVTSAIVHYCNESTPSPRASPRGSPRPDGRAPSPRRLVWVESSFVGSRPITSPETPTSSTHAITPTSQLNGHDLPESGEVTSRPPQPPGEYLLAW